MNNKYSILSAALIALGIVVLGLCIKGGIDNFANKDRKVTVKGLAEKEVDADKVTWPIVSKELGDDLPDLYTRLGNTQAKIKRFLTSHGIKASEISVNAPIVIDLNANQYGSNDRNYRYNITSVITVTSNNVKLVRSIIARQADLLKEGVAIVDGGYENPVKYEYVSFQEMKPEMMEEAIASHTWWLALALSTSTCRRKSIVSSLTDSLTSSSQRASAAVVQQPVKELSRQRYTWWATFLWTLSASIISACSVQLSWMNWDLRTALTSSSRLTARLSSAILTSCAALW